MVLKFLSRLAAGASMLLLSACYMAQAARGQLEVMRARQPIDKLLARPSTSDDLKAQLVRARRIRDFASETLGLPDNDSYRSYADIGRRYVVWNVVAAPEFSVVPRQWCFPVAGCVSYRGYFSEQAARNFAAGLRAQGDDVTVGGVPAYSTLGRIADPLLNTVAGYGELDMAALVFHELAHQVVWLPGDTAFNEAFATAVEEEGVARYAAAHALNSELDAWRQRRALRVQITGQIIAARDDLARLYRLRLAPDAMRERKAARLGELGAQIQAIEREAARSTGFGSWVNAGLNNAYLASVATYYDQVPYFESMLRDECGGYLPCLYTRVQQEAGRRQAEARAQKKAPR